MTRFFDITELRGPLFDNLSKGLAEVCLLRYSSIPVILSAIEFDYLDGTCLRITSNVHEQIPRLELGYLIFSSTAALRKGNIQRFAVPSNFRLARNIQTLISVYDELPSIRSATGVALSYSNGEEVVVAAGAFPLSVTIKASFINELFDPEFPVEACERHALVK